MIRLAVDKYSTYTHVWVIFGASNVGRIYARLVANTSTKHRAYMYLNHRIVTQDVMVDDDNYLYLNWEDL